MIKREANHERWHPLPPGIFEDARLSYKALGLLCYLLSRPDDWEVRRSHLVSRQEKDGKSSVQSALKELVDAGYARLEPIYDPATKQLSGQRYVVSDFPRDRKPVSLENRGTGNLVNRKPGQQESGPLTYSGSLPSIKKRLKTEKREERAREDFETGEADRKDAEEQEHRWTMFGEPPPETIANELSITTSHCTYPDPVFSCGHEQLAMQVATEILGRPVKKKKLSANARDSLHTWVHEHPITDTTRLLEYFVANEPDISKWTIGFVFAPEQAEARLQAATSPPLKPATKETPSQDRPLRFAAYKEFPHTEPEWVPSEHAEQEAPTDAATLETPDIKAMIADVTTTANMNLAKHEAMRQKHTREDIAAYLKEHGDE